MQGTVRLRIVVLSGTGFLGPFVVGYLCEMGHDVTIFHSGLHEPELPPQVKHIHSPLAVAPLRELAAELLEPAPDVVVHMVPFGERDARLVVDSVSGVAGRLVAVSSQDVYRAHGRLLRTEPGPPDPMPLTEESPLREKLYPYRGDASHGDEGEENWVDHYDKILVEAAVMGDPRLPGTILRLPRVYGPGDRQHRLFHYVKRMDDQRSAILLHESVAGWRSSRGYVENVAWAIALAVASDHAAGRIYNVSEVETASELEWVREIADAVGWNGRTVVTDDERLGTQYDFSQDSVADDSRIRRDLGYVERLPRGEALRRTIEWERANPPTEPAASDFDYATEDAILQQLAEKMLGD